MKNVNKIALVSALMLFVGLLSNSNCAYAQRYHSGGSVGIHLPNIGLHIDNYGVRLHGPRLNIDTHNHYDRYNRYSYPRYDYRDPSCRPPYSTYPRYDYGRPRYTPSYPPTYNRYNNYQNQYNNRQYQEQLRQQREQQERLRREQERYQRNMDRILRDLHRDCR